jgi:hypothetical protein
MIRFVMMAFGFISAMPAGAYDSTKNLKKVELLVVGDSQTGTPGSKSYFGNFFQRCLKEKKVNFVTYGRGSTRPEHWLNNGEKDQVTTIMRNAVDEEVNLGWGPLVPRSQKRLKPLMRTHRPEKVMAFFGDNFILHPRAEIMSQSQQWVQAVRAWGISRENCFFLTATYEMEVESNPKNPDKNYRNTLDVDLAIRDAIGSDCRVIDGLEVMNDSKLLQNGKLKRIQPEGETDCFGKSANDNVHYCGEAARELADHVCSLF